MTRPDFSNYVAHFTKDARPCGEQDKGDQKVEYSDIPDSAYDRLVGILKAGEIKACRLPWVNRDAVCFTECPWWSLPSHAARYSPYGIGFTKDALFARGGNPVFYVRPDVYDAQQEYVATATSQRHGFGPDVHVFTTTFLPAYAPQPFKDKYKGKKYGDWSHEREWRIPRPFTFKPAQVRFVIVNTHDDVARIRSDVGEAIAVDKFLVMDMYRRIEQLWPTHVMPEPPRQRRK